MFGPAALAGATLGAVLLLAFRQLASPTAHDIRKARQVLEEDETPSSDGSIQAASTPTPIGHVTPVPPKPQ